MAEIKQGIVFLCFFPNKNEQARIVYLVFIGRVWMSYDCRLTFFKLINFFNVEPLSPTQITTVAVCLLYDLLHFSVVK